MSDGKHSSKRDVVILSIKPKRPEYPSGQKFVAVSELLQEWDKLDAYYRGQLLKLTKSLTKSKPSKHSRHSNTPNSLNNKVNKLNKSSTSPVNKKHSSSLSSDQFTELFGDENLFDCNAIPADSNNNSRHHNKHNKLLHSRSLNNLFDEDSLEFESESSQNSQSRKNSLSSVGNLVVSIPVLSVPRNVDRRDSYESDEETCASEADEEDNFLSVPRDNFQVQYEPKQKTRVALVEKGGVSPKWIVPVRVAPYKPPTAQGLNGVQIQKILYHKNDSVNNASPTTTSARTPDKPPDSICPPPAPKSVKVNTNSPVSTVSPRSTSSGSSNSGSPPAENNNATPKQVSSPELSPPKLDQQRNKSSPSKLSPPVNSTTGMKLKRPIGPDGYSNGFGNNGKKSRHETCSTNNSPPGFNSTPVTSTSSNFASSASSCDDNDYQLDGQDLSPRANSTDTSLNNVSNKSDAASVSGKKLNVIKKNPVFLKPASVAGAGERGETLGNSVFIPPAAVSITERIIKKASMPQPELIERQKRRRLESSQRKSYAMQKGDEHEEKESIDLSMKSFEMIWNVPLLSPLRSP